MVEHAQWSRTAFLVNAVIPIAVAAIALLSWVVATAPSQAQPATINVAIQPAVTALPMVVADKKRAIRQAQYRGQMAGVSGPDF